MPFSDPNHPLWKPENLRRAIHAAGGGSLVLERNQRPVRDGRAGVQTLGAGEKW
jgi:hypothetical protein